MYRPTEGNPQPRRRKKRCSHGLRSVEVARGKSGYGFTISGQSPCILSCIVTGSPADRGGLKTGDFLLSVNGQNVSRSCHDEVVRLIGSSRGVLILQIAENINNSSDSSEDESQTRPKSKYPNRARVRGQAAGRGAERPTAQEAPVVASYPHDRYSAQDLPGRKYQSRAQSNRETSGHDLNGRVKLHHRNSSPTRPSNRTFGIENVNPLVIAPKLPPPRPSHGQYERQVVSKDGIIRYRSPSRTKHTIITREARLGLNSNDGITVGGPRSTTPLLEMDNQMPPAEPRRRPAAMLVDNNEEVGNIMMPEQLQVVIGYAGSIDMPRHSKLQTVRGAVRRLRVEQRIHTLVLMDIGRGGIKLVNSMCCTVARYGPDQVAFSGICPEDNRFFGVITLHQSARDPQSASAAREDSSSSCHVFMVDPDLCPHGVHVQHAQGFGLRCHPDPTNSSCCAEFPSCASPVVRTVSYLMRASNSARFESDMAQIGAFVPVRLDPVLHRRESNSSNSDSGLSFGREESGQQGKVCVVELHGDHPTNATAAAAAGNQDISLGHDQSLSSASSSFLTSSSADNSVTPSPSASLPRAHSSLPYSSSSKNHNAPSSLHTSASLPHISASSRPCDPSPIVAPQTSSSSNSSTMERLKVRAMPDPKGFQRAFIAPTRSGDQDLDEQTSADNLRLSYHKIMKSRTLPSSSTGEAPGSHGGAGMGGMGSAFASLASKSNDTDDLSMPPPPLPPRNSPDPTSLRPQSHTAPVGRPPQLSLNLPSAPMYPPPPPPCFTPDSTTNHPHSITKPPLPDRRLRRTPRTPQRPTSSGSFTGRSKSTPPIRNTLDATVPLPCDEDYDSDPGAASNYRTSNPTQEQEALSSTQHDASLVVAGAELAPPSSSDSGATCVSALTKHGLHVARTDTEAITNEGRAAGWAISFDRLVKDDAGLAAFTEFLKKEYSEENIVFWKKCEQYRNCNDLTQRKQLGENIFSTHLSSSATEPINVDSQVRKATERDLPQASRNLLDDSQKQIWLLMKHDSYPRFLKSELYKQCVMAEMERLPFPCHGGSATKPEANNNLIPSTKKSMKKVRTSSGTEEGGEERRRKSLLPWNRNKSDKKLNKGLLDGGSRKGSLSSNGSALLDAQTFKEVGAMDTGDLLEASLRVTLPDNDSVSVKLAKPGQCVRDVLLAVCEERSLQLNSLLAVDEEDHEKLIRLDADVQTVTAVKLLPSTILRLDLPGSSGKTRTSVGVRVRQGLSLKDALSPAFKRHGVIFDDNLMLHVLGTGVILDEESSADEYNLKHIVAQSLDDFKETGGSGSMRGGSLSKRPPLPRSTSLTQHSLGNIAVGSAPGHPMVDLFHDIADAVTSPDTIQFDDLGIWDPDKKTRSEENRNSGIFSFITTRRNSMGEKDDKSNKLKSKSRAMFSGSSTQGSAGKLSLKSSGSSKSKLSGSKTQLPISDKPSTKPQPPTIDKSISKLQSTPTDKTPYKPSQTTTGEQSSPQLEPAKREKSTQHQQSASDNSSSKPQSSALDTLYKGPQPKSTVPLAGTGNRMGSLKGRPGFVTEEDRFFDLLSRTSRQMDDQRGLTKSQLELPDFLKVSPSKSPGSKLHRRDFCNSDSSIFEHAEGTDDSLAGKTHSKSVDALNSRESSVKSNSSVESTPRMQLDYADTSFSRDGVMPSHVAAVELFTDHNHQSLRVYNDGEMAERDLPDIGLTVPRSSLQQRSKSEGQVSGLAAPLARPRPAQRRSPQPNLAAPDKLLASLCSSEDDADITLIPPSSSEESEAVPSSRYPSPPDAYRNPPVPRARKPKPHGVFASKDHQLLTSEDEVSTDSCSNQPRPKVAPRRQFYHLTPGMASDDSSSLADSSLGQLDDTDMELDPHGLDMSRSTPSPTTHSLVLESDLASPTHSTSHYQSVTHPPHAPHKHYRPREQASDSEGQVSFV